MSTPLFQIVITRPDGEEMTVPVQDNRVNIGSRENSHVRLIGDDILPNQARLLVASTEADSVLFIDLSSPGSPPVRWPVGDTIGIGSYRLRLERASPAQQPAPPQSLPRAEPSSAPPERVESVEPATMVGQIPPLPDDITTERLPLPAQPVARQSLPEVEPPPATAEHGEPAEPGTVVGQPPALPDDITTEHMPMPAQPEPEPPPTDSASLMPPTNPTWLNVVEKEPTWSQLPHPEMADSQPAEDDAGSEPPAYTPATAATRDDQTSVWERPITVEEVLRNGIALPAADESPDEAAPQPPRPIPYLPDDGDQMTQPKDWEHNSNLSAQLTINPVNVVSGERVRVPVSVRNASGFDTEVRIMVAGLPQGWDYSVANRMRLGPGEVNAVDLVIQTRPGFQHRTLVVMVYVSSVLTPSISIPLPLTIVLKRDVDLAGRLENITPWDNETAYLYLQNHTQGNAQVFISGQSENPHIHVIMAEHHFQLAPGQNIRVPVRFGVSRRPLLRSAASIFWVSAQQGTRAPLDYSGTVRVRPSVGIALLLAVTALMIVVLIAGAMLLDGRLL